MDIGQPKDYLSGQKLHLSSLQTLDAASLSTGANIQGAVLIDASAQIDPTALVGPNVVVGPNCKIGAGSRVSNSTLLAGSSVGKSSYVDGSIIGWNSHVKNWCRVTNLAVIGENVNVKDLSYLNGTKVLPHKDVAGDFPTDGTIVM